MAARACFLSQFSNPRAAGVRVSAPRRTNICPSLQSDEVATRTFVSTNSILTGVWFAPIQNFSKLSGGQAASKRVDSGGSVELSKHPVFVLAQESGHILVANASAGCMTSIPVRTYPDFSVP